MIYKVRFRLSMISSKERLLVTFDWLTGRGTILMTEHQGRGRNRKRGGMGDGGGGRTGVGFGEVTGGKDVIHEHSKIFGKRSTLLQVRVPYTSCCSPQPFSEKQQHVLR